MNQELISVIIPIYNVEKYLNYCVESVVNQSYKNIEIILIDDGSPDSCPKICDDLAKIDARIIVIHKSNGGLSDARNAGLDIAKGDYIYFLDSDDSITPDAIEKLYTALTKTGSDMALGNYISVNEDKEIIKTFSFETDSYILTGIDKFIGINKNLQLILAWNKLYKKEIFKEIRFPYGKINEDLFIVHLVAEKCNKVILINDITYRYLLRTDSIMRSSYTLKRLDDVEGYLALAEYYIKKGFLDLLSMPIQRTFIGLSQAYSLLDLKDKKNYERIEEIRAEFKRIYKIANKNKCFAKKDAVDLYIFILSPKLHTLSIKLRKNICRGKRILKKLLLVDFRKGLQFKNKLKKQLKPKQNIFIMATPVHSNLGDHAIVRAEHKIINDSIENPNIIEISNTDYRRFKDCIKSVVGEKDLIVIDGGGNLGTLWTYEDDKISDVIASYKNNKIIVFPQTSYYENSKEGQLRLAHNKEVYSEAKDLTIFLRDKTSYDFTSATFKSTKAIYVPDSVLYLEEYSKMNLDRNACLLCFRKDKEKVLNVWDIEALKENIQEQNISIRETSTLADKPVNMRDREFELKKKLSEFASAKLVITDRLHAMIFSAITGTPCIALDNLSKKVSGVHSWIKDIENIKVCSNVEEVIELIPQLYGKDRVYTNKSLLTDFNKIKKVLKS